MSSILQVTNLKTSLFTRAGEVKAVDGVSFHVLPGETVGVVGESGCGKTMTALSIMNLLPSSGSIRGGSVVFSGRELLGLPEKTMRKIRGNELGMIFQEPTASLNPVYTVGNQIIEPLIFHRKLGRSEARKVAVKMLGEVGIPNPERRINQYPHQLSGGMQQRVAITMAVCCRPKLLIADEPTSSLDVTVQMQIIEILTMLNQKLDTSIIFITHNLGILARICRRVIVMYAGGIVEQGTVEDIFSNAQHPYTQGLLDALPGISLPESERLKTIPGQPPNLLESASGCLFYPRCGNAMQVCKNMRPPYFEKSPQHTVACWLLHPDASWGKRKASCG